MNLSDVMGSSGLQLWAELGLVISFTAFIALVAWLFIARKGPAFERESHLPLEDGPTRDTVDLAPPTSPEAATEERKDP